MARAKKISSYAVGTLVAGATYVLGQISGVTRRIALLASNVENVPTGGVSATTVQGALEELDSEKVSKSGGTMTDNLAFSNGKGIDFSATPGTGTSELLNDYEEGTFTPAAGVSLSPATGKYTKVGRAVHFVIEVTFPVTASTAGAALQSLPFTASAENFACAVWTNRGTAIFAYVQASSTDIGLYNVSTGGIYDYVDFSADSLKISGTYFV